MTFCVFHVHLTYPLSSVLAGGQNVDIKLVLCEHLCFVLHGFISLTGLMFVLFFNESILQIHLRRIYQF